MSDNFPIITVKISNYTKPTVNNCNIPPTTVPSFPVSRRHTGLFLMNCCHIFFYTVLQIPTSNTLKCNFNRNWSSINGHPSRLILRLQILTVSKSNFFTFGFGTWKFCKFAEFLRCPATWW